MNTLLKICLVSLSGLAVSSCGYGYNMHHSGAYGYSSARIYERTFYPAAYVGPYPAYSPVYVGENFNHYYGGMGGRMH